MNVGDRGFHGTLRSIVLLRHLMRSGSDFSRLPIVPRNFTSFIAANVCIDTEVLFYFWRHDPPIHRYFHTYVGSIGMGIVAGVVIYVVACVLHRAVPNCGRWLWGPTATPWAGLCGQSLVAGIIGGVSHVFLDSLVHYDLQPFWPIAAGNSLAGIVGHGTVYIGCTALGFFGSVFCLMFPSTVDVLARSVFWPVFWLWLPASSPLFPNWTRREQQQQRRGPQRRHRRLIVSHSSRSATRLPNSPTGFPSLPL